MDSVFQCNIFTYAVVMNTYAQVLVDSASPNTQGFDFLAVYPVVFSINVMNNVAVLILYHHMILLELIRLQPLK